MAEHPSATLLPPGEACLADLLDLEPLDRDLFRSRVCVEEAWLYGGQVFAQAIVAAGRTAEGRRPHSAHGYFLRRGDTRRPLVFAVERDRDGRSLSARRVVALQGGEVVLNLAASFAADDEDTLDHAGARMPATIAPAEPERADRLVGLERAYAVEAQRALPFPPTLWVRPVEPLPDDPLLAAAGLAYLSDMSTGHSALADVTDRDQSTVDHGMWFHRPPEDGWLLLDLRTESISQGRGLYRGSIWSQRGTLLASLAQESLFRRRAARG